MVKLTDHELSLDQIRWLCLLYDWKYLTPSMTGWALVGDLHHVYALEPLGLVEKDGKVDGSKRSCFTRITKSGEELLETRYPVQLLTKLLRSTQDKAVDVIGRFAAKLPIEALPELIAHSKPSVRLLGRHVFEQKVSGSV